MSGPISCGKAVWEGEPATEGDVLEVIACGGKEAPRATGGGLGHLSSLACVTGGAVVAPLDLRRSASAASAVSSAPIDLEIHVFVQLEMSIAWLLAQLET